MRWLLLTALLAFSLGLSAPAQTTTNTDKPVAPKKDKTPTGIQQQRAEPVIGEDYPHIERPLDAPSEEEVGPVLARFARASNLDNLAQTQNADNASLLIPEKMALDKRITIPKIHDVDNNELGVPNNPALAYEITYLNWGAVTSQQYQAREGHYFTITWKNHGPKADFVARFEYRQIKSKEIVRTLTQAAPHVSGATRSYFAVVNRAYIEYGPVVSWRFSILKGDTIVAQAKSFVW